MQMLVTMLPEQLQYFLEFLFQGFSLADIPYNAFYPASVLSCCCF